MEKESLTASMKNSISNVLETMFFLPLDFTESVPTTELWKETENEIIAARLDFVGTHSGYCVFYIPRRLAVSMTADFMGKNEEDVSDDQAAGTVLEITNMIAGNTFSLYNTQSVYNLNVPEQVRFSDYQKGFPKTSGDFFIVVETLDDRLAFQMILEP